MKLKVLIIVFNIVLLTVFFTMLSFSFFTVGTEFIGSFFKNYWIFILFFLFFLIGINIFFIKNWKLITVLEAEDWPALSLYLETEIFKKRRFASKKIRLLCEISILLGDFETLNRLERMLEEYKPKYIHIFATRFAAAKVLLNDYDELAEFSTHLIAQRRPLSPWIYFYEAFSAQMLKRYREAAEKFWAMLKTQKEPLIRLLGIYFIDCGLRAYLDIDKDEVKKQIDTEKDSLRKHPLPYWEKYAQKEKQEIHILVLTKAIDEALIWLFKEE